jgi:pSer/pThr/pTyr-binding forkhead associated (FHA) protein
MSPPVQPVSRLIWNSGMGIQEHLLKPGDVVTIGRGENNQIVINSPKISRNHARIEWSGERFTIRDLGSSNGTFINGQRVESMPFPLKDGDEITLERFPIKFEAAAIARVVQDIFGMATVPAVGRFHEAPKVFLKVIAGPDIGQEFEIVGEVLTIGRVSKMASWEVCLNDRTVSRPHSRIEKNGSSYFLIDLGSANGTTVNGLFAIEPVMLNEGDVIGIGETRLTFFHGT